MEFSRVQRTVMAASIPAGAAAIVAAVFTNPAYYANSAGPASAIAANGLDNFLMDEVHLVSLLIASYLLPLGFLTMAWITNRGSPKLASAGAALSLVGFLQTPLWAGQDSLYFDISRLPMNPQYISLVQNWNSDPVMSFYSIAFGFGSTLGPMLIGLGLWRIHAVSHWAAVSLIIGRVSPLLYPILQNEFKIATFVVFVGIVLFFVSSFPISRAVLRSPLKSS